MKPRYIIAAALIPVSAHADTITLTITTGHVISGELVEITPHPAYIVDRDGNVDAQPIIVPMAHVIDCDGAGCVEVGS